jgi:flavoprotein
VTPEETVETLEQLAERLNTASIAFTMSQAAYYLVKQQRIIEELRAEISTLQTLANYE